MCGTEVIDDGTLCPDMGCGRWIRQQSFPELKSVSEFTVSLRVGLTLTDDREFLRVIQVDNKLNSSTALQQVKSECWAYVDGVGDKNGYVIVKSRGE